MPLGKSVKHISSCALQKHQEVHSALLLKSYNTHLIYRETEDCT